MHRLNLYLVTIALRPHECSLTHYCGVLHAVGGKFEPSEMYDDGSFLYTAAMLEAVNYEEALTS